MTQEEVEKVKEIIKIHKNTDNYTTQDVLQSLQNGGSIDQVTFELFRLIVKRPRIHKEVYINKSQPWVQRILEKGEKESSMFHVFKWFPNQLTGQEYLSNLLFLYNSNYKNTRKIIHLLDDGKGRNKIPYFHLFFIFVFKKLYNRKINLSSMDDLKLLFSETHFDDFLDRLIKEYGYLKKLGGETFSFRKRYDNLDKFIKVDTQSINDADIGLDIGGGFMTPALSRLFKKNMVCLDKNNLSESLELSKDLFNYPEDYIAELKNQKYIMFDSMTDSLPKDYNSYFITSFGFMASTVAVDQFYTDKYGDLENPFLTYMSCKRVSELIVDNKEVYIIMWARPTTRVSENKLISLKFKNGVLTEYDLLSDPDSTKYCTSNEFGCSQRVNFV